MANRSSFRLLMHLAPALMVMGCKPPHPTYSLNDAIKARKVDQVESNLYWGCDVNATLKDSAMTPVQLASSLGDKRIVKLLVERGDAKYEPRDALYGNDLGTIEYLLDRKPLDQSQAYALYSAALNHYSAEGIRYLASKGMDASIRGQTDAAFLAENNSGLMHEFVRTSADAFADDDQCVRLFEELLTAGAEINATDENGQTPLGLAVELENHLAEKLLRAKGALYKGNRYAEEERAKFQADQAERQKEAEEASRPDAERLAEEARLWAEEQRRQAEIEESTRLNSSP